MDTYDGRSQKWTAEVTLRELGVDPATHKGQ